MIEWTLVELDEVGSTQTAAQELADRGAPEGTTVVAKSQTSGKGRLGRAWVSPPGGLYMSFILRPAGVPRPELTAMVSAAAIVEGIKECAGLDATIRWPNDIMVLGKKLAGVIAQAQSSGANVTQAVVGLGVNCNASVSAHAGAPDSTSLAEELGREVDIALVRRSVLGAFSRLYERWQQGLQMTPTWRSSLSTLGKQVKVKLKTDETPFTGVAKDVDEDGALILEHGGQFQRISSGGIEWLREAT